jgi:hypothetical protein
MMQNVKSETWTMLFGKEAGERIVDVTIVCQWWNNELQIVDGETASGDLELRSDYGLMLVSNWFETDIMHQHIHRHWRDFPAVVVKTVMR